MQPIKIIIKKRSQATTLVKFHPEEKKAIRSIYRDLRKPKSMRKHT